MSKKRFGGFVLASALVLSAVTVVGLASCGSTEKAETITAIAISNKSTLQAAWKVGEASRSIEATITGSQKNFSQLVSEGTVTITSSDASVVKVEGVTLTPLKDGKVTITVASGELKDTVEITIAKAQEKVTSVSITNKETIAADFHVGDEDRTLTITTNPVINIPTALSSGRLTITATGDAVTVTGNKIKAVKEGTSKITVKCDDVKDEFDITVLPERVVELKSIKELEKDAATNIPNAGKYYKTNYKTKGVVVSTNDNNVDTIIYDGESFGYVYTPKGTCKVGDTILVTGTEFSNYFGNIEINKPTIEVVTDEAQKIKMPTATTWNDDKLIEFTKIAKANNSTIADPEKATDTPYIKIKATYNGVVNEQTTFTVESDKIKDDSEKTINIGKTKQTVKDKLTGIAAGTKFELTGSLLGFNGAKGYFNFTLESFRVTDEVVYPTAVTISSSKSEFKVREKITIDYAYTPAHANTPLELEIIEGKEFAKASGDTLYGLAEGKIKVKGKTQLKDKTYIESAPIELTVKGVMDDLVGKAENVESIDKLIEAPVTNEKFYKVKGIVTEAKSTDNVGAITITDRTTKKSLTVNACVGYADAWKYTDNKITGIVNPKTFGTEVLGKLFDLGDEVEFVVNKFKYNETDTKENYNIQFFKVAAKANTIDASIELKQDKSYVTASKTEGIKIGDEITLTTNKELIEEGHILNVKLNGSYIAGKDGVYTFKANYINKLEITSDLLGASYAFNASDLGLSAYSASTEPVMLAFNFSASFTELADYGDGIQSRIKNSKAGSLWLESTAGKEIESITITASKDWKETASIGFAFGTEKVNTVANDTTNKATGLKKGNSVTITSDVKGAQYFCFKHIASGAVYIESVKINFKVAA